MSVVFDIGGTTTRIAVGNREKYEVERFPTTQPHAVVDALLRILEETNESNVLGGVPGIISSEGMISASPNLPHWEGVNLVSEFEKHGKKLSLYNDADLGGLGEAVYGAGKEFDVVGFLTVGTGVGGSRIVSGHIDRSRFGFEPGRVRCLLKDGEVIRAEERLSGKAVEREYGMPPKELESEDEWRVLSQELGILAANVALLWSPDVIVLGGSMVYKTPGFITEVVREVVEKELLEAVGVSCPVVQGVFEDDAGLMGAFSLMDKQL